MAEMISLNYAGCLKEIVGETGITIEELNAIESKISEAFNTIQEKKKNGKLGFMEFPFQTAWAKKIKTAAKEMSKNYENFVVIGMGGAASGSAALHQALRHPYWNMLDKDKRKGGLRLFVLDNIDPDYISGFMDIIDVKKTIFNIVSKSGTTAECLADFFIIKKALEKKVGKRYKEHIIITTDAVKGYLRDIVVKDNLMSFEVPLNTGGRFAILSPVSLLSAVFTGIDIEKILFGAAKMNERCLTGKLFDNPAALYATIQYLFYWLKRPISVMMSYSNCLNAITDWYTQLWSESLGKKFNIKGDLVNAGPTSIKTIGVSEQQAQLQLYIEGPHDKLLTFLSVENFNKPVKLPLYDNHYLGGHTLNDLIKSGEESAKFALTKENRPYLTIILPAINPEIIGQLIYMFEMAAVYAGELFEINTFEQPGIELEKQFTNALMGRSGLEEKKKQIEEHLSKIKNQNYII